MMTDRILRAIATILLLLFIAALLCSCARRPVKTHDTERFMLVELFNDCRVYVDLQTGVEWIRQGSAFAPAIDSYGRPLIWPGFDAREDRLNADR